MRTGKLKLVGGWGYDNLGDEAILAAYRTYFDQIDASFRVLSVSPTATNAAQQSVLTVGREFGLRSSGGECLLVCGGGYLNGAWVPQVQRKLLAISRLSRNRKTLFHAVELRNLDGLGTRRLAQVCLSNVQISVRDEESAKQARRVAKDPQVEIDTLPDAISLGHERWPKLMRDLTKIMRSRVLVNFMDINARGDVTEAMIDPSRWNNYVSEILDRLGDSAVGLVIGNDDETFMQRFPQLPLVRPRTVSDLLGLIQSSAGLISVRMHPALIASQMGTPCVSIPYCGKVFPTHERIGIEDQVVMHADAGSTLSMLESRPHHEARWARARAESEAWLSTHLEVAGTGARS